MPWNSAPAPDWTKPCGPDHTGFETTTKSPSTASGTATAAPRGTRRNSATSAAPTSATVVQYSPSTRCSLIVHNGSSPSVSDFAGSPMNRVYGNTSGSPSATSAATAVTTRGRGAPSSTQASSVTTSSGTRKNRYRSCTRSDAKRDANIATARVLHTTKATVAARCSCTRGGTVRPSASSNRNARNGTTPE